MNKIYLCLAVMLVVGCSEIKEVDYLTAGTGRKEELLGKRLDAYTKAWYWGAIDELAAWIEPEIRARMFNKLKQSRRKERLVDLEIQEIEIQKNGDANVDIQTRFYREPTYIVDTRTEKQVWKFHRLSQGWMLADSSLLKEQDAKNQQVNEKESR